MNEILRCQCGDHKISVTRDVMARSWQDWHHRFEGTDYVDLQGTRNEDTHSKGKNKSVPLQAQRGPKVSNKLRFKDFVPRAQDGGRMSAFAPAVFTPRKCSCYSFLLEAEWIPGPYCDRKDFMSMKNLTYTSWNRTSDLPICSTAP